MMVYQDFQDTFVNEMMQIYNFFIYINKMKQILKIVLIIFLICSAALSIFTILITKNTISITTYNINTEPYLSIIYGKNLNNLPIIQNVNNINILFKINNNEENKKLLKIWNKYKVFKLRKFDKNNINYCIKYGELLKNTWVMPTNNYLFKNIFNHSHLDFWNKIPTLPKYFEVTSTLPQNGPGNWFNVVKGSGMFYIPGKTLIARNKIDALIKLNFSAADISKKYGDDFEWNGWGSNTKYSNEKKYIKDKFNISNLTDLLKQVANNYRHIIALEWISDCPILDKITYQLAKQQDYQTVWYYSTGYQGSYWSNELMCVNDGKFEDIVKKFIITPLSNNCNFDKKKNYLNCSQDFFYKTPWK